jgi:hypothetical protein
LATSRATPPAATSGAQGTHRTPLNARAGEVRRLAVTKAEAAASLGVSVDFFEVHVQPELRVIRRGRLVLVPVRELERWVERSAALTLAS